MDHRTKFLLQADAALRARDVVRVKRLLDSVSTTVSSVPPVVTQEQALVDLSVYLGLLLDFLETPAPSETCRIRLLAYRQSLSQP